MPFLSTNSWAVWACASAAQEPKSPMERIALIFNFIRRALIKCGDSLTLAAARVLEPVPEDGQL
jgi:hypothetical protein